MHANATSIIRMGARLPKACQGSISSDIYMLLLGKSDIAWYQAYGGQAFVARYSCAIFVSVYVWDLNK